jgi:microcystin-dependent protein
MKRSVVAFALAAVVFGWQPASTFAAVGQPVPESIPVQGVLQNALDGSLVSGTVPVYVALFASAVCTDGDAGCRITTFTFPAVTFAGGVFSVDVPARDYFRDRSQLWVRVSANQNLVSVGDRVALLSSPYAFQANHAELADAVTVRLDCVGCVGSTQLQPLSLKDEDFSNVAGDRISGDKINGVALADHTHPEFILSYPTSPVSGPQDAYAWVTGSLTASGFVDSEGSGAWSVDPSSGTLSGSFQGSVSVGNTTNPAPYLLSVGPGAPGTFRVDTNGNAATIAGVGYTWPTTKGATVQALTAVDGAGTLAWSPLSFKNVTTGILVDNGTGTYLGRTLTGTTGQIVVANGNGVAGNMTVGIDSTNLITLPGTAGAIIPTGTTAQQAGVAASAPVADGAIRFNTTKGVLEFYRANPVAAGSTWVPIVSSRAMLRDFPVGTVVAWAGVTAPTPASGWLPCDGTEYLRTGYPALFAALSTTWGYTDAAKFRVPDLTGQFLRGWDSAGTVDKAAASRVAKYPNGATGNNIGTYEYSMNHDHTHTTGGAQAANPTGEGRPNNAYVKFLIKW